MGPPLRRPCFVLLFVMCLGWAPLALAAPAKGKADAGNAFATSCEKPKVRPGAKEVACALSEAKRTGIALFDAETKKELAFRPGLTTSFNWSPDGSTLAAFVQDPENKPEEKVRLAVLTPQAWAPKWLGTPVTESAAPVWSPDGKEIWFGTYDASAAEAGRNKLWSVEVASGAAKSRGFGLVPSFSADGKLAVFRTRPERRIEVIDATGAMIWKQPVAFNANVLVWNPAGTTLAVPKAGGTLEIQVVDVTVPANQLKTLVADPDFSAYDHPQWSADGERIFTALTATKTPKDAFFKARRTSLGRLVSVRVADSQVTDVLVAEAGCGLDFPTLGNGFVVATKTCMKAKKGVAGCGADCEQTRSLLHLALPAPAPAPAPAAK